MASITRVGIARLGINNLTRQLCKVSINDLNRFYSWYARITCKTILITELEKNYRHAILITEYKVYI